MNNKTKILELTDYKFESKIKLYFSLLLISENDYIKLKNIFDSNFEKLYTKGIILPVEIYYIVKNHLDKIKDIYKKIDMTFDVNQIMSLFRISEISYVLKEYLYNNPNIDICMEQEKNKFYEYFLLKQIDKFPSFSTIRNFLKTCTKEEIDYAIRNLDSSTRYEYYKIFGKDGSNKVFIRSWNTRKDDVVLNILHNISISRETIKINDVLMKIDTKEELLKQDLFNYIRVKLGITSTNEEIIKLIQSLPSDDIKFLKDIYGESYNKKGLVTNSQKLAAIIKKIGKKLSKKSITVDKKEDEERTSINCRKRNKEYYLKKYNITEELLFKILENQPEKRRIYVKEYVFDNIPIKDMMEKHNISYQTIYTNVYEFEKYIKQVLEDDFIFRKTKPRYTKEMYMKENNITINQLLKAITYLPNKQKIIIKKYFGIECLSKTIKQIAKEEKHTQLTIVKYKNLAKENIMKIINSNYEIIIEEEDEKLDFTEEELIEKYNISEDTLLEYINLLGDKQKWSVIYYLELEKDLTKQVLKDKYGINKEGYESNVSHGKKRLIELLDNKELEIINNKTEFNTLLKELSISRVDFFCALEVLSDYKIFCITRYYGIETNKLTLQEIAKLRNKKDYNIRSNINKAKIEIKEIISSGKIYDIKLNKIRTKLKEYLIDNENFKEKLKVLNYEASVALTLIVDFNFNIEQVKISLGYYCKEKVISILLNACSIANLSSNDVFKPGKNYKDANIVKIDLCKKAKD